MSQSWNKGSFVLVCVVCFSKFKTKKERKTCSAPCARFLVTEKRRAKNGTLPIQIICPVCGKHIECFNKSQKLCSVECRKKWNKEKGRQAVKKYWESLLCGNPGSYSPDLKLRFEILKRDTFKCQYCGREGKEKGITLHIDHVIPKSLGGEDSIDNLITSCLECNLGKSDIILQKRLLS